MYKLILLIILIVSCSPVKEGDILYKVIKEKYPEDKLIEKTIENPKQSNKK